MKSGKLTQAHHDALRAAIRHGKLTAEHKKHLAALVASGHMTQAAVDGILKAAKTVKAVKDKSTGKDQVISSIAKAQNT